MTHAPLVSNLCPVTAIVFVFQNLFYGKSPMGDLLSLCCNIRNFSDEVMRASDFPRFLLLPLQPPCCENALEFRQIDDIRWLDAARRAFLEGMKQRMKIAFHVTPAQRDASIQEQESSNVSSKLVAARTTEYRRFARVCPRFSNKRPFFAAFFGSASDRPAVFLADHSGSPRLAPHRCGNSSKPGAEGIRRRRR